MLERYLVHERLCFRCVSGRCGPSGDHTLSGDIHKRVFASRLLGEELEVLVYLPPGFSENDPWRYPTLYLHDGQNVFDEIGSAFGVEWGVDEATERLMRQAKMRDIIIVAVPNTAARIALYTPFPDSEHGGGEGEAWRAFLIEELKPWIDNEYPTSGRASETALAGSSLGGLSALYIGWSRPDVFGIVAALSPSLWWADGALITSIAEDEGTRHPDHIWLDAGSQESALPDGLDDLRRLRGVLLSKGFMLGKDLFYSEVPGATHDEASWAARIEDVLCTLFPVVSS